MGIRVPELTADEATFVKTLRNVCDQLLNSYLEKPMSEAVLDIETPTEEIAQEVKEDKPVDFTPIEDKLMEFTRLLISDFGLNLKETQALGVYLTYDEAEDGVKMRYALTNIGRAKPLVSPQAA